VAQHRWQVDKEPASKGYHCIIVVARSPVVVITDPSILS
jgi:hypothetical protein